TDRIVNRFAMNRALAGRGSGDQPVIANTIANDRLDLPSVDHPGPTYSITSFELMISFPAAIDLRRGYARNLWALKRRADRYCDRLRRPAYGSGSPKDRKPPQLSRSRSPHLISFVRHEKFSACDPKMFRLTGAWVKKDPW